MNKKVLYVLGIIVLSSGLLGSLMLTRGQTWGDDFAAYILQAQSIVTGRMNQFIQWNTFTIEQSSYRFGPVTFPWGFPVLLAAAYSIVGMKILAFKLVLTVCYMAFLVVFFLLARTRLTDAESLLLTAVLAFNVNMLQAQNGIVSDIPFLLWSTLGLLLMESYRSRDPESRAGKAYGIAIGLVIFMAAFTRPNGFLLLVPLAATQWVHVRQSIREQRSLVQAVSHAAMPYAACGLGYALQAAILPSSAIGLRDQWVTLSAQTVWHNLGYYFWLPEEFTQNAFMGGKILYLALLIVFIVNVARRDHQDVPMLLYGLATIVLYVVFPLVQGARYIYPVLPIFLLLAFQGMKATAAWLKQGYQRGAMIVVYGFWAGLAVTSLAASLADARDNISAGRNTSGGWQSGPFTPASTSMFDFIRQATPPDSIIIFFKPRAMRLLADRSSFFTSDCGHLPKGDYVVLVDDNDRGDQVSPEEIAHCNPPVRLQLAYRQQSFIVYQILHGP